MILALISAAVLLAAALLTGVIRKLALSHGMLDVPNERSSHTRVTPRGGGLAIVISTTAAAIALASIGRAHTGLLLSLVGGGAAVAIIGFLDDRRPIPARFRLIVHIGAAAWAVAWIGAPGLLSSGDGPLHWLDGVLSLLGIVWTLNLFNFMDGIDGIAASEGVFVSCGLAALALVGGIAPEVADSGLVLGAACGGFLLWNWPRARIFMGDVGSGYLGYFIGVLGLAASRGNPASLWVWLILGGVFFVDATVTLLRRILRGDRVYEAHRSHAYQWLARRWGSHKTVTIVTILVNLLWLLPCAWFAARNPQVAMWIAFLALFPLVIIAFAAGAGRREGTQ